MSNKLMKFLSLGYLFSFALTANIVDAMQDPESINDDVLRESSRSYVNLSKLSSEEILKHLSETQIDETTIKYDVIPNVVFNLVDSSAYESAGKILWSYKDSEISKNLTDFLTGYEINLESCKSESELIDQMKSKID